MYLTNPFIHITPPPLRAHKLHCITYMKLYSPQGQKYYTTIDSNNKKEGNITDNFAIEI